ncbi:PAP2 superfamily [Popillia japonica]|uniref:PAP2 superfamily n=1 Tax=Popillia japonica TaxID=7064 RepID=A0AAW1IC84_POPJA
MTKADILQPKRHVGSNQHPSIGQLALQGLAKPTNLYIAPSFQHMFMDIIQFLRSDQLVANIQSYFGVQVTPVTKDFDEVYTKKNNGYQASNNKYECVINNKFWYYLFKFGTELGDELFYSMFIPFWFWNIDGAVGRRVILVWAIVMCIGQAVKDIVRWSRPEYPAVKLQNKWVLEYGMPSTHAMVGVSIPFSVLLFTLNRYQYNIMVGLVLAVLWCTLICVSRVYLGMHSVLDIIAGLALSILLMVPLVPLVDQFDNYFITSPTGPLLCLVLSILTIIYYPASDKWTPTRGDSTMIVSVCVGVQSGSWLNYPSF